MTVSCGYYDSELKKVSVFFETFKMYNFYTGFSTINVRSLRTSEVFSFNRNDILHFDVICGNNGVSTFDIVFDNLETYQAFESFVTAS